MVWCGVNQMIIHFFKASILPRVHSSIHPFLQIILVLNMYKYSAAWNWINSLPQQQRRPLPSLLSVSSIMTINIPVEIMFITISNCRRNSISNICKMVSDSLRNVCKNVFPVYFWSRWQSFKCAPSFVIYMWKDSFFHYIQYFWRVVFSVGRHNFRCTLYSTVLRFAICFLWNC